ncbi:MAG: hypothetical protein ABW048_00815, partial [Sphingobium sp.]
AIAAAVASGGALVGAVGAAGSLGAALTTSSGAVAASAAVLDVVSVGVEIASTVAMAQGDEKLAGILGWVGLGTGIASMGAAFKAGAKAARNVDNAVGRMPLPGRVGMRWSSRTPHAITQMTDPRQLPIGRLQVMGGGVLGEDGVETGVRTMWHKFTAGNAIHYAADSQTNLDEVLDMLPDFVARHTSSRKVRIYLGAHGMPDGDNYISSGRASSTGRVHRPGEHGLFEAQKAYLHRRLSSNLRSKTSYVNISNVRRWNMKLAFETPGLHIHARCYGAADPVLHRVAAMGAPAIYSGPMRFFLLGGEVMPSAM